MATVYWESTQWWFRPAKIVAGLEKIKLLSNGFFWEFFSQNSAEKKYRKSFWYKVPSTYLQQTSSTSVGAIKAYSRLVLCSIIFSCFFEKFVFGDWNFQASSATTLPGSFFKVPSPLGWSSFGATIRKRSVPMKEKGCFFVVFTSFSLTPHQKKHKAQFTKTAGEQLNFAFTALTYTLTVFKW